MKNANTIFPAHNPRDSNFQVLIPRDIQHHSHYHLMIDFAFASIENPQKAIQCVMTESASGRNKENLWASGP